MTPQMANTIMSTNKWRERPTTRGSFRRRKYFLIEPTVVVAAMRSSGKAGDTGNPPENHRRRTLDQVKGFAIIEAALMRSPCVIAPLPLAEAIFISLASE